MPMFQLICVFAPFKNIFQTYSHLLLGSSYQRKKCFNQLSGACSTQNLVEIHNTWLKFMLDFGQIVQIARTNWNVLCLSISLYLSVCADKMFLMFDVKSNECIAGTG